MDKKTKTILGVLLIGGFAYFLWQKSQKDKVLETAKAKTGFAGTPCGNCGGVVGNKQ